MLTEKKNVLQKWKEVIDESKKAPVDAKYYRDYSTAMILENLEREMLNEAVNVTAGVQNWDPVMIPMVRRLAPRLIAHDVMGFQAMDMPTGLIFALVPTYAGVGGVTPGVGTPTPQGGAEALGIDEPRAAYSGTGTDTGTNPFSGAYTRGTGWDKADGETKPWAEMGVTVKRTAVEAKTRNLRANYSIELAQDMQRVHGLDADAELVTILTNEMLAEINREIVGTIYTAAKQGAQFAGTPGAFDLQNDADGRWAGERFRMIMFAIERDANAIAAETRRGKGNIIITSSDVASALAMAGALSYAPAIEKMTGGLEVDVTGTTFAGMAGRFKVFIDPYATGNGYVVGFKGANPYDAGIFYAPYIPAQLFRATDASNNFASAIGIKHRGGIVANPFTSLTAGQNAYYRKAEIKNL